MQNFKPQIADDIIEWIKNYKKNANAEGFVIGISGGKDSAVAAGLLAKAVGSEKILALLMPNGEQKDIDDSILICNFLKIKYKIINIASIYHSLLNQADIAFSQHTLTNIPPRLRMTLLYAFAQERNYLVCGTGNASEKYIGYSTKWGDSACDLNPIGDLLTDEVVALGEYLNLPDSIIKKVPADGLSGKTDEANIGFTYAELNQYIRTGMCKNEKSMEKIDKMHKTSRHKFDPISTFIKQV